MIISYINTNILRISLLLVLEMSFGLIYPINPWKSIFAMQENNLQPVAKYEYFKYSVCLSNIFNNFKLLSAIV